MKTMLVTLLAAMTLWQVNAAELVWKTDLAKAQAQAKSENKTLLLDFTGSDWCGWCIKFKKEALDTDEFKAYAAKNLVLVEVDFPHKTEQAAELKKANAELKTKFDVHGFPTFVVLSQDGKEIGRQVGYDKGGAAAFIAKIEGFKKK